MEKKAIEEMTRMETHASFPYLIEITEPDGTITRYCNADNDINFEGNVYSAYSFKVSPPERKLDGISNAKVQLSVIDTTWIAKVRNIKISNSKKKTTIRFIKVICYEDNDEMVVESLEDIDFKLTSANWNQNILEWTMKYDDMLDVLVPFDECDEVICPALV